jgi:glyoxylase-like metal-dependent hydrolase (beta-lactamase superfamily II)
MNRFIFLLLGLVVATTTCSAQKITTIKITDSIYMLEGSGGNVGVSVGTDGILVIDSQFPNMATAILEAIERIQKGPITFLVNTHFHGDHTGGNEALAQKAPVIGHTNVRSRMAEGKDLGKKSFRNSLPVITYDDSATVHFNGEDIQLKHYPTGHTDSDSVIYFPNANVMHMGDHFFVGRFPFIDLAGGGDVAQYIRNVESILEKAPVDVTIIPGHGPLADLSDLKAFLGILKESTAQIQEGIDAGKSVEAIQKEGLPDKFKPAEWGFVNTERWIAIVHESLTR